MHSCFTSKNAKWCHLIWPTLYTHHMLTYRLWLLSCSLLHSVNLILFTLLLVHLILRISPHHSHHLHSHHLSLPLPFTPDSKLISFTNPFLHSHSYSFRTDFTDLNLYWIKGALALFLVSGYVWHRCDKRLQRLQKILCKSVYYFVNVYLNKNHMSETKQNYDG